MRQELKDVLFEQISGAVRSEKPTTPDHRPNHNAVFTISAGKVSCDDALAPNVVRGDEFTRVLEACDLEGLKPVEFLLHTSDTSVDCHSCESMLTFAYCKGVDQKAITVPNPHITMGWVDRHIRTVLGNDRDYKDKLDKSVFAGALTGSGTRAEYCESVLGSRLHDAHITGSLQDFDLDSFPHLREYYLDRKLRIRDQLRYKFNVTIDGNALCYCRLYWQMASNSVPVYINRMKDQIQLHDYLLQPDVHYVETTIEEWPEVFNFLLTTTEGQEKCEYIRHKGTEFVNLHFMDSAQDSVRIMEFVLRHL